MTTPFLRRFNIWSDHRPGDIKNRGQIRGQNALPFSSGVHSILFLEQIDEESAVNEPRIVHKGIEDKSIALHRRDGVGYRLRVCHITGVASKGGMQCSELGNRGFILFENRNSASFDHKPLDQVTSYAAAAPGHQNLRLGKIHSTPRRFKAARTSPTVRKSAISSPVNSTANSSSTRAISII